jgi:hypothetical protein
MFVVLHKSKPNKYFGLGKLFFGKFQNALILLRLDIIMITFYYNAL